MDRRQFLIGAAAGAALPLVPAAVAAAPVPQVLHPVWAVGTEGGMDWQMMRAPSLEAAIEIWRGDTGVCSPGCECCDPDDVPEPDGHRVPKLDDKFETTGRNRAAQIAGWLTQCDRCDYDECSDYYVMADDEAVCTDCMTLADWRVVDPAYYAEQIDELLTEEYGPDLRFPEHW